MSDLRSPALEAEGLQFTEEFQEQQVPLTDLVAAVGNHEAKALTFLTLWSSGQLLRMSKLSQELGARSGEFDSWQPAFSGPFGYCQNSLEPIGFLIRGSVVTRQGDVPAYGLTDLGRQVGVPLAGLILDWSLRHPDISVQDIFGPTQSSTGVRAVQTRMQILEEALTNPGETSLGATEAISDEARSDWTSTQYKRERTRIDDALRALGRAGIIDLGTIQNDDDRRFTIVDPSPPTQGHPRGSIAEAVYEFVGERFRQGNLQFDFDSAISGVRTILSRQGHDVEDSEIRARLNQAFSPSKPSQIVGIQTADGIFNKGLKTKISLVETYREAVTELLNLMCSLEGNDPTILERGTEMAAHIINTPELVAQLMNKSFRFSSSAQKLPFQQTMAELENILREQESGVSAQELAQLYRERVGRRIGRRAVANAMRELNRHGRVEMRLTNERKKAGINVQENIYTSAHD